MIDGVTHGWRELQRFEDEALSTFSPNTDRRWRWFGEERETGCTGHFMVSNVWRTLKDAINPLSEREKEFNRITIAGKSNRATDRVRSRGQRLTI